MTDSIRIAIIGTGSMAENHAVEYQIMDGVQLVAAVDVNAQNLQNFCDKFNIINRFTSVDDLIAWGDFDAVSNVTPDKVHYQTTMPLLRAGKHILCEKPLAVDYADAQQMATAAHAQGVVNMVNLTYRRVDALQHAHKIVAQGRLGNLRYFEASYLQSWLTQPAWGDWKTEPRWLWRLSKTHGSKGVLGDLGVHILDFVSYITNSDVDLISTHLKTFDKANNNTIGAYTLDVNDTVLMLASLKDGGATGTITATRFATGHLNDLTLRLHGDKGALIIKEVLDKNNNRINSLQGCIGDQDMVQATWRDIPCPKSKKNYHTFIEAIKNNTPATPDFQKGADLQKHIDYAEQLTEQQ